MQCEAAKLGKLTCGCTRYASFQEITGGMQSTIGSRARYQIQQPTTQLTAWLWWVYPIQKVKNRYEHAKIFSILQQPHIGWMDLGWCLWISIINLQVRIHCHEFLDGTCIPKHWFHQYSSEGSPQIKFHSLLQSFYYIFWLQISSTIEKKFRWINGSHISRWCRPAISCIHI